jgi:hypothetical protein
MVTQLLATTIEFLISILNQPITTFYARGIGCGREHDEFITCVNCLTQRINSNIEIPLNDAK